MKAHNDLAKMRASPFSSQAAPDDLSNSESYITFVGSKKQGGGWCHSKFCKMFFFTPHLFLVGHFFSICRFADNHGLVILVDIPGPWKMSCLSPKW